MSDVAEVKEAIEYLTTGQGSANLAMAGLTKSDWDQLAVAVDAARRWVRMVETGERVEWCVEHGDRAAKRASLCYRAAWLLAFQPGHEKPNPCRIVSRLVAAVGVEKETL